LDLQKVFTKAFLSKQTLLAGSAIRQNKLWRPACDFE